MHAWCQISPSLSLSLFVSLSLFLPPPSTVSGLTILNERTAQCQSALGKLQRGRKAKPSMRLSTCLIHTKERALKHKSLLVSISAVTHTHDPQKLLCFIFLCHNSTSRFPPFLLSTSPFFKLHLMVLFSCYPAAVSFIRCSLKIAGLLLGVLD